MRHALQSRFSHTKDMVAKFLSYTVFIAWALITIVPLFWMGYSSFKSNEELTRDIYSWPKDLFDNYNDEYVVIAKSLNVILDYNPKKDTRERLIIESTTIAPTRRLMVHFLVKEDLPPAIAALQPGDKLTLDQLPGNMRRSISWKTMWFNYRSAFVRGGLGGKFVNSVLYAGISTTAIIILGLMIGFAVSKMGFPKLSMLVSGLIGFGYLLSINSVIIPLYLMISGIGLSDTHLGIILVYTAFGLPLAVMLSSQFISGLPDSLVESAYIDGANTMRMFLSIIVPMCSPVVVTISIMSALGIWNEFVLVLVLASKEITKSLPVGVYSFSSLTSTQLGWQLAALVMALLPAMIVYFAFSKRLSQGVVAGSVKG